MKNAENDMRNAVTGKSLKAARPASDERRSAKRAYDASATRRSYCKQKCLRDDGVLYMKMPRDLLRIFVDLSSMIRTAALLLVQDQKTVWPPLFVPKRQEKNKIGRGADAHVRGRCNKKTVQEAPMVGSTSDR